MSQKSRLIQFLFIALCILIVLAFIIYALIYGVPNLFDHRSGQGSTKRYSIFFPDDFR